MVFLLEGCFEAGIWLGGFDDYFVKQVCSRGKGDSERWFAVCVGANLVFCVG